MALVSGPLSTVTTTPSAVSQVNISINSPRTRGAGVMTPEVKTVAVTGGVFSSQIAPGPAVLTLLIGGRESAPIPILVDDVESQTLAEVAASDHHWTPEQLSAFQQLTAQAEAAASAAEADRIQTGKDRVQTGLDRTAASQSAAFAEDRAEETGADRVLTVDASAAAVVAAQIIANHDGWSRPPITVPWWGVGDPVLTEIPHLQVGDIIERLPDGQRWKVEAS